MAFTSIRVTKEVHKKFIKELERKKKSLKRNVTASELIGDMVAFRDWSK